MELCTSFWFWFIVLGSFAVLLWSAFNWGWSLGARNSDLQWQGRVKTLYKGWEQEAQKGDRDRQ